MKPFDVCECGHYRDRHRSWWRWRGCRVRGCKCPSFKWAATAKARAE